MVMYHQWPRHCSRVLPLTWKEKGICLGRGWRTVGGVREENRVQDKRIWWKYMTCLNENITMEPITLHNQYIVINFLRICAWFPLLISKAKCLKRNTLLSLLEDIHCRFIFGLYTVDLAPAMSCLALHSSEQNHNTYFPHPLILVPKR